MGRRLPHVSPGGQILASGKCSKADCTKEERLESDSWGGGGNLSSLGIPSRKEAEAIGP